MEKLYNTTDIFHLYYVDVGNQYTNYNIKTFSKEWWRFIWDSRPKFRIRIKSYCK